jgi:predicted phage terminase large subunit-like protein
VKLSADVVAGFAGSLLHKNYDNAVTTPDCHTEWWEICCSDSPQVAIAAPRRHAKSTAITLAYALACVLFRNRSYVLIVSDTITQATQFLGDVKRELADNDNIRQLFKIQEFLKDTEDDVIVKCVDGHEFRISAKGSEQKMRGLKWKNKRPDLIICDDMENDEIVMNKDRRDKFKRWFYAALLPSLAAHGVIRVVGTILHEDSLLNNLMPSEWNKYTKTSDLRVWSESPHAAWKAYKYDSHTDDFSKLLWPQMYTAEWFIAKQREYFQQGIADSYSQEYRNRPIDESIAYFKRGDFLAETQEDKKIRLNYYIAADLAISKSETADYSVFVVAGVDENKILHVRNVIRERLDGREIVDTIFALQETYQPELFGIEEMQVSKAIGPFLREEMMRRAVYPNIIGLKHGGKDKIARARSIQARLRVHTIKFDKSADWYPGFEDELCKFPRGAKDDQVDAIAYIGLMLDNLVEAPSNSDIEEEDYYNEYAKSGLAEQGRSQFTGY